MLKYRPVLFIAIVVLLLVLALQPRQTTIAGRTAAVSLTAPFPYQASNSPALVVVETVPDAQQSDIYRVDPADLSRREMLAQVSHLRGYPPEGRLSADGNHLAMLVIPPTANEQAARTTGGNLWIADSSGLRQAAVQVGFLAGWSPENDALLYGRLIPLADPLHPEVPYRTEIYRMDAGTLESTLLLADLDAYGVQVLGWSADQRVWIGLLGLDGNWRVQALNPTDGGVLDMIELPKNQQIRRMSLSPQGSQLVVEGTQDGQDLVTLIELSGSRLSAQASIAAAPYIEQAAILPLKTMWSAGGNLLIYRQPGSGQSRRSECERRSHRCAAARTGAKRRRNPAAGKLGAG